MNIDKYINLVLKKCKSKEIIFNVCLNEKGEITNKGNNKIKFKVERNGKN